MKLQRLIGSVLLLVAVVGTGGALLAWKQVSNGHAAGAPAEHMEAVTAAVAVEREHARSTTAVGTVLALRSVRLRNELSGTVREVALQPGAIVEAGTVLVALDVSVEEAELRAREAEARLAETLLGRVERASLARSAAEAEVDRARAQRDVALAEVERIRAVIERKTVRAPFRARVGLADVHPGQFLDEGTELTTLQSVDYAVHVDFSVAQDVAAGLAIGDEVTVFGGPGGSEVAAAVVAVDARVDPRTRNATVRALVEGNGWLPAPGSAVRVRVPTGPAETVVTVPVSALRKGPGGDVVFALEADEAGAVRARERRVRSGAALGDEVIVEAGLAAGEEVAASGSFKLYEGVLVAVTNAAE